MGPRRSNEFVFGTLVVDQPGVHARINKAYEPSEPELKKYMSSVKKLNDWLRTYAETYALVEHTYFRFKSTLEQVEHDFKQIPTPDTQQAILAINAEFLGFLGMVRLYLDHTETKLKKSKHKNATKEFEVFTKTTSGEFDNRFAYRFCYKLRNFSQHCGFPITGFNAHSGFVNNTPEVEHVFGVSFVKDYLLEKYDGWTKVKKDLEQQPEQFAVLPIVDELMVALRHIHKETLVSFLPRLNPLVDTINQMLEHAKDMDGQPYMFELHLKEVVADGSNQNVNIHAVPFELLKIVDDIKKAGDA